MFIEHLRFITTRFVIVIQSLGSRLLLLNYLVIVLIIILRDDT